MNTIPDHGMKMNQYNVKLAQAYVPYQEYRDLYNVDKALYRGTIFKELFRPYKKK